MIYEIYDGQECTCGPGDVVFWVGSKEKKRPLFQHAALFYEKKFVNLTAQSASFQVAQVSAHPEVETWPNERHGIEVVGQWQQDGHKLSSRARRVIVKTAEQVIKWRPELLSTLRESERTKRRE